MDQHHAPEIMGGVIHHGNLFDCREKECIDFLNSLYDDFGNARTEQMEFAEDAWYDEAYDR